MRTALAVLRTLAALAALAVCTGLALAVALPLCRLVRSPSPLYRLARIGLRIALVLAGVRATVEGRERLGDARNLLLTANHASHLDGPILFLALGVDFAVVLKSELAGWAPLRPLVRAAGFVPLERGAGAGAAAALESAAAALRAGRSVLVFPEGTRSRDGRLQELKKGAFVAARAAGSRVAPVAVIGTQRLLPRGRLWIRAGGVRVVVKEPIDARGHERDALAERVRESLASALGDP